MNKNELQTNKMVKDLGSIKNELEVLRLRRREMMWRLHYNADFSYPKIAEIYGCSKQYVEQEVSAYQSQEQPA